MDDDALVVRSALRALAAALDRHTQDGFRAGTSRAATDMGTAFASLVECTFWVATLDEWLCDAHKAEYKTARDEHPAGGDVLAMVWARDRHYHQLPFSTEPDDTPFLGPDDAGPPFHIAYPGLLWRSADVLAADIDRDRRPPRFRAAFVERAAGEPTPRPVARALELFRDLARTTDLLPAGPADEDTATT